MVYYITGSQKFQFSCISVACPVGLESELSMFDLTRTVFWSSDMDQVAFPGLVCRIGLV